MVRKTLVAFAAVCAVVFVVPEAAAQVSLTTLGTPYTQSFDTLPASGSATWTNNSTIPGWFHARTGTGTTIVANDGSSNAGNLYSYGTGTATDRALGSVGSGNAAIGNLFWGVRLQNNTGATITTLDVTYVGEQWRNSAAAAQTVAFSYLVGSPTVTGSLAEFQSAGVAVTSLDFTSPITGGTAGALNGNLAANRVTITFSITGLSIPNGTEVMLRWSDPDHIGADHGLSIDDFAVTPQGAAPNPPVVPTCPASLSTTSGTATSAGVSATDSNGTVTAASITGITPSNPGTITLINFVAAGGVGGTATATLNVSNTTPVGSYNVTIQWSNNDGVPQTANCVVAVNVTAPVVITPIHDIQGSGTASPLAGQTVTARGIVTLLKSNGFFLQEELADYDANNDTSEGIFVFTSSAPTVAVGDDATVTGTATEFNNLTEISPVTNVTVNSSGNTLPTAVTLTGTDLPTTANFAQPQLEKYEGMRLFAASLTTVAPNDSFFDVYTVLSAQPRPFREPGIPASDPVPPDPTSGLPDANIPIWDENPERLIVDTNGRAGSTGETLTSNVTLTNVGGPLDFAFSQYRLINEANLTRTADMSAVAVPVPAANEFTVAGYNIENFNNNATQRQKAALTIRDVMRLPDVIGTVEIFDLADLQALATEIQSISGVTYSAHLIEQDGTSEDSDQDVGFLVKTSRVSVTSVTQERAADTFINPNTGLPETLHDRPPLVLRGTVDPSGPAPLPIIVVVNHMRSFIDIELVSGEGVRVRAKRKAQAESIADLLNDLQTDNPGTPVISVGDYNAFHINNGYDDPISVLKGTPTPDDQIVVDQSPDLVNPNYSNLIDDVPAAQRYSFIFEGTPQALDHVLVNAAADALNTGIAVARVNSDFPAVTASVYASNAARPEANSDHDPVVGYFQIPNADLSITKTDSADPVNAGQTFSYSITVDNAGPSAASTVSWTDNLPVGTTFVSLSQPGGWSCTTPSIGASGTVTCSIASLGVGSAAFTLTLAADPGFANASVVSNTATVSSTTPDPDNGDLSDTETTTVNTSADLQLSKSDSLDPVTAGTSVTYQITVTNNGPSHAASASWTDTLPAGTTFSSLATAGTWSCTTPSVGATGSISCTNTTFLASASDSFTLILNVDANVAAGTVLSNTATVSSSTSDPSTGNESDTETTTVAASADLQLSKTDTSDPVNAGSNLTYQITVANNGPSNAASASWSDNLPAGTTFVSISSVAGWSCTDPGAGNNGTVSCSNSSFAPTNGDVFTLVVNVSAATPDGTVLSNTATVSSSTSDPNSGNESGTETTNVATAADLSVTKTDSSDPVNAGTSLTYTITVSNAGPSAAASATLSDTLPAGTTFVSLSSPAGWSCTTPAVGAGGTVSCTNTSFALSNGDVFTLIVNVDSGVPSGTILSNTATVSSSTSDPNTGNESDLEPTTVGTGSADLGIVKTDTPDPIVAGSALTYTLTVTNTGPSAAANVTVSDTVPAGTTFLVIQSTIPAGWSCNTPGVGGTGTISCTTPVFAAGGNVVFSILLAVNNNLANGTVITNTATVSSSSTPDPNNSNDSSTTTTTVQPLSATGFTHTKTITGDFRAGGTITITATMTNNMGHDQGNNFGNEWADILPPQLTLVSASAPSGTLNQSIPGGFVTWNGVIPNGTSMTITVVCTIKAGVSGTVSNQAFSSIDTDNNGTNETSSPSDDPSTAAPNDPTTITVGPSGTVTGTKTVSGSFVQGTNVTYTIVLTNNMLVTQPNNFQHEFTDIIPASLTYVSSTASSGTAALVVAPDTFAWDGSIPAGGSVTITITATIKPTATGTVSNQGNVIYDNDGGNSNDSSTLTDNPSTGAPNDPTSFNVVQSNEVLATKSVSGTFIQGTNVVYTIVMTNHMSAAQPNNFQHEFTDILPPGLTYVSSTATSGTTGFCCSNTFFWDGSIPSGGSVTITITALISPTATGVISNQGQTIFDTNSDASNDDSHLTDDPSTAAVDDPTSFTVIANPDTDGDGVDDVVEQAAPNGGDGNGDGIPDYQQGTVASLPAATGNGYLTLQSSCTLHEVEVHTEGSLPQQDPHFNFPHGLISFEAPCSSATFSLFLHATGVGSVYRKFGPLPAGGTPQWYTLPGTSFSNTSVGGHPAIRVNFSLTDGGTGDDTPVDGVIVDQGGPGVPAATDGPTLSPLMLMLMAAMLGMIALWRVAR